jgi:UDP-N-acetylglucosamine:LPS N-acetylglucosamine transferase
MTEKRVLILTSDTGGGHTSAARALEAGLGLCAGGANYLVHIAKAMEENGYLTERLGAVYNYLLRNRQQYVQYYHWAINRFRPDRSRLVYRFGMRYGRQLVGRFGPNVIVSVHPMMQAFFARLLAELDLADQIPLVTVVTDPCGNSWKGWADDGVRLYLVAHEEARRELLSLGVPDDRIRICGMPIHPKFEEVGKDTETRQVVLSEFGLDPSRFTVLVNAGWIGGGNIPELFRTFAQANLPVQAIFVAGRNEALRREAEARAASATFPVRVVGYSDQMERVMASSDLMVSKLGGLTTFEALACRLPILGDAVTRPMPQEERTAMMLENAGAALMIRRVEDLVPAVRKLVGDPGAYRALRDSATSLGVPDATKRIVSEIERLVPVAAPSLGARIVGVPNRSPRPA